MSYWELQRQMELFKKMRGEKYKEVPQGLIDLEKEYNRIKGEVEALKATKAPNDVIAAKLTLLANAEFRYREAMKQYQSK